MKKLVSLLIILMMSVNILHSTHLLEIFVLEADGLAKNTSINTLLGYPNLETKTMRYRNLIKHKDQALWAGAINDELINACEGMGASEKANYYNDSDLKDYQYLLDNNWLDLGEDL